jgi:hypothetical protein
MAKTKLLFLERERERERERVFLLKKLKNVEI